MDNHLKITTAETVSLKSEEQNRGVFSNDEKQFLDLLAEILIEDILNEVKETENEK